MRFPDHDTYSTGEFPQSITQKGDRKVYRLLTTTCVTTMIAALFCYALSTPAQSIPEEKQTRVELLKLDTPTVSKAEVLGASTEKKDKKKEKELDERRTFDFSLPGDNRAQSLAFFLNFPLMLRLSNSRRLRANSAETTISRLKNQQIFLKASPFGNLCRGSTLK